MVLIKIDSPVDFRLPGRGRSALPSNPVLSFPVAFIGKLLVTEAQRLVLCEPRSETAEETICFGFFKMTMGSEALLLISAPYWQVVLCAAHSSVSCSIG